MSIEVPCLGASDEYRSACLGASDEYRSAFLDVSGGF